MSVDTKGKLKGKVSIEDVANFIEKKFGIVTSIRKSKDSVYEEADYMKEFYGDIPTTETAYISFEYNCEKRNIFYFYSNYNTYENLEMYSEYGLEEMVKSETTDLIIGCWGSSVEIMKSIVAHFGGWVDEDDCDDNEYYEIEKSDDKIKPVKVVTMEEIYQMFGEKVVIKK